ncbi:cell envelope biogenesis protein OmpA [Spirochaetia bacterium]|nr:cell envelope biogenesis protein OmpA [Spirochaetia bacterium]
MHSNRPYDKSAFFIVNILILIITLAAPGRAAAEIIPSPFGADAVPDLYSPALAGAGAFITSQGGAPASALNPAAGGDAQRIVFDLGYLGLPGTGDEGGYGNVVDLGALFPTKYAVFGGSMRLVQSPFDSFPVKTTFGGNFNAAKGLLPGMSLGAGLNYGFGGSIDQFTLSGDLGFRYNLGKIGPLSNFTWAAALRGMGKSWTPSWFTPMGGLSFDFVHVQGEGDKPDPIKVGFAADLGIPSLFDGEHISMTFKTGFNVVFAETVIISLGWPSASGINVRELANGAKFPAIPSVGIGVNFNLKSGGKRIVGGKLPDDGVVTAAAALRPLYNDIYAIGAGVTWTVGAPDKKPPVITVDYPETAYISPNNDGLADELEFPVTITDQRYIASWVMEIRDGSGAVVRSYRNKDRRPETAGVKNFISLLKDVKSGVEVPPALKWDGIFDTGESAPDGEYTFTITASDDNGNTASTAAYTVVVDNTPPRVEIAGLTEAERIFSPDGDGNKDTLSIGQSGSFEELWEEGIYDAAGNRILSLITVDGEPHPRVWDGANDEGFIVPDGVYTYRIRSTDRAQNTEKAALENIIVSTIQPRVNLIIADAYFSPNADGVKDTIRFAPLVPVKEGITGWSLQVRDMQGNLRRTINGNSDSATQVPARLDFDGRNDQGMVLNEGVYQGSLSVNYRNGYVSSTLSPSFTLDITPPTARVSAAYPAFSPDNDGNQDEMIFRQEGSNEIAWIAEIRRANGPIGERPVRAFHFAGTPPAELKWDGHGDAGTFAADGEYTYELYATDPAGNTGRSGTLRFGLSTADTPVMLATDLRAFSPNADGVKDSVNIIPQIQVTEGITGWKIDILDSEGRAIRTFEGRNAPPASTSWNGRNSAGTQVPDGTYTARIELRYVQGNQPAASSGPFVLDTAAPRADLSTPFTLFSPNGDGRRDFIPLNAVTEGNDEWEGIITDSKGQAIRTWRWTGAAPNLAWNGADEAGNNVSDGAYQFTLRSTDEAGNSARMNIPAITVDARLPRAFLTASVPAIAPRPNQAAELTRFNIIINPLDGIESWKLELKDEGNEGSVLRTFTGAPGSTPPANIGWNGLDEKGAVREGKFTPNMTVTYTKGDLVSVQTGPVTVDVSGPVLSFASRPEYFSPDNDGVDDELFMTLGARDASPIANWSLEIREPEPPRQLFYRIEGRGSPAERLSWDGRSNKGELVQAATDYPFVYRAVDSLGNSSTLEGSIGVDVLVIRDGDLLRIQISSIVFRANAADFRGIPRDRADNNTRVLRRVAEILNKFRDYRITVEGHANPVLRTAKEENEELKPLSEARARAVMDMLTGYGVNRSRLSAMGMGGTKPVVSPLDADNRWKNRRVEFILNK